MPSPHKRSASFHRWLPWLILGAVVVLTLAVRWRLRDFPLERDEGEYAYNAQRILEGEPPYLSSYASQKYPGTYFASAAALAVWPELPAGLHFGLAMANVGAIVLLFLLMRRLAGDLAACTAAATYAVLSIGAGVLGFAAHATHFVVLPMLGGLLLLLRVMEREKSYLSLAGSGALFGLAILVRQPAAAFAAFGGCMLVVTDWRERRAWFSRAATFSGGVVAPIALLFAYLWIAGVFPKFWFWTFTYAAEYGSQLGMAGGLRELSVSFPRVVGPNLPIWLSALAGLVVTAIIRDRRSAFIAGWIVASIAAVSAGLYFREHYFVQLLPVVAALTGMAVAGPMLSAASVALWRRVATVTILAVQVFCTWRQADYLFTAAPEALCRKIYGSNLFPEAEIVARALRARSQPGDKLAVLGSEAQIYPMAGLRSATGFLYTYALMEESPFAERFQREMIGEIEGARPRFVVLVNSPVSWLIRPRSPVFILNWMSSYLRTGYRLIGVVSVGEKGLWDAAVPGVLPGVSHLAVFERRSD